MQATDDSTGLGSRYHVAHLRTADGPGQVDPGALARVFGAPWQTVALVTLAADQSFGERDLNSSDALIFITSGTGVAQMGHGPVELREGISLTLFKDERLDLCAGPEQPLEFFFVEMRERPRDQPQRSQLAPSDHNK